MGEASGDLDDIVARINGAPGMVRAWEALSDIPLASTRAWVRKSVPILERIAEKADNYLPENVSNYYKKHRSNSDVTTYPSTSGTGIQYDALGHPDFTNHIKKIRRTDGSSLGRASYEPSGGITGNRNVDAQRANEWAQNNFHPDDFKFTSGSNTCRIKDPSSPLADSEGFVIHTWHHHQDGKTMMAVPVHIHSSTNAVHIGGVQAKETGIVGFFDSPIFPD